MAAPKRRINRNVATGPTGSAPCQPDEVQFHDRGTQYVPAALAIYLGYPKTPFLVSELGQVRKEEVYQCRVFFIRNLGFCAYRSSPNHI